MSRIIVKNRLKPSEAVRAAIVTITDGAAVLLSDDTNNSGVATIDTSTVPDGVYAFTIVPASTAAGSVGPTVASSPTPGDRIFRTLSGTVTLAGGVITAVAIPTVNDPDGTATRTNATTINATLQPVWMKSPNEGSRGTTQVTMIIVHHTGGPVIGPAINTFLSTGEGTSAHYLINTDGQIVKMVQDGRRANHAGVASWGGHTDINSRSIGIEIVNSSGTYPAAQYDALLDLIASLRATFPTIVDWDIVGHSDVATTGGVLGRKSSDPGSAFEWSRLEGRMWGMNTGGIVTTVVRMLFGPTPTTMYAGFFAAFPAESLRSGDSDATRRFGGAKRTTITGNPIRELQDDLTTIGYTVGTPDGGFGGKTDGAVKMFQEHFFAGGRGHKAVDGRVDQQTAQLIKNVAGAKP